jgi:hypothetical protein
MRNVFSMRMSAVHDRLRNAALHVNGDGRFSSPGHTALYGLYTLMDCSGIFSRQGGHHYLHHL